MFIISPLLSYIAKITSIFLSLSIFCINSKTNILATSFGMFPNTPQPKAPSTIALGCLFKAKFNISLILTFIVSLITSSLIPLSLATFAFTAGEVIKELAAKGYSVSLIGELGCGNMVQAILVDQEHGAWTASVDARGEAYTIGW